MSDRFDHRCEETHCPSMGQRSTPGGCKCHRTREQMMLAYIERLENRERHRGPSWDSRSCSHDDIFSTDLEEDCEAPWVK